MKQEKLLELIGGVDESLLMETEQTTRQSGKTIRRCMLLAAIVAALAVTAIAATERFAALEKGGTGTAQQNTSTSVGTFVYSDGSIYYGSTGCIYRYDTQGKLLQEYPLESKRVTPFYLFATEDAIAYSGDFSGLTIMPKDGSETETIFQDVSMTAVHVEGTQLYTTDATRMLTRIDLVTREKTELMANVISYYVDDSYIYAIPKARENCYYRSPKDAIAFERIELDFCPNKVIADGDSLYFCQWIEKDQREDPAQAYRVNRVQNGVTTQLPVYSWFYQVKDNCVLYRESETYMLKSYDLETGETEVLVTDVFEFEVLEDRYLCVDRFNQGIIILDMENSN